MRSIDPYLNLNGTTEEAFKFYRSVFGGEFLSLTRYKEIPDADKFSEEEGEMIAHIALSMGKNVLMGSDSLASMGKKADLGNSVYMMINAESEEEARGLFEGLSAGGKVEMPLEKTFWGDLYGTFVDKFGIWWMIDYPYEQSE